MTPAPPEGTGAPHSPGPGPLGPPPLRVASGRRWPGGTVVGLRGSWERGSPTRRAQDPWPARHRSDSPGWSCAWVSALLPPPTSPAHWLSGSGSGHLTCPGACRVGVRCRSSEHLRAGAKVQRLLTSPPFSGRRCGAPLLAGSGRSSDVRPPPSVPPPHPPALRPQVVAWPRAGPWPGLDKAEISNFYLLLFWGGLQAEPRNGESAARVS